MTVQRSKKLLPPTGSHRFGMGLCLALLFFGPLVTPALAAPEDIVHLTGKWVDENAGGAATVLVLKVMVERNRPPVGQETVFVDWSTSPGTATGGIDYQFDSGTAMIPAGATEADINITIFDDSRWENDEFFNVDVVNISGAQAGNIMGQVYIKDNDQGVISVSDALGVLEGDTPFDSQLFFNVSLDNGPAPRPFSLDVATIDTTAINGTHFLSPSSPLNFFTGDSGKVIAVSIIGDSVETVPATRSFDLVLTTSDADVIAPVINAKGSIQEDDAALPPIEYFLTSPVPSGSVLEGDVGPTILSFDVFASSTPIGDVQVDLAYVGTGPHPATEGTDFVGNSTVVVTNAGSATANVTIIGDTDVEFDETFDVVITNVTPLGPDTAAIGSPDTQSFTIQHDDYPGLIVTSPLEILEGDPPASVKIAFSVQPDAMPPVTINPTFDVDLGLTTATTGSDYVSISPVALSFTNMSPQVVEIDVVSDLVQEATLEALAGKAFYLHPISLATIEDDSTTQIRDDDTLSTHSAPPVVANEGDADVSFVVTFTPPLATGQTLIWSTSDGGGGNPAALAGSDYTTEAGSQFLAAGTSTFNVNVPLLDDGAIEPDEDFSIDFDLGGVIVSSIGTIQDDEVASVPTVADVLVGEGAATASFTVNIAPALAVSQTLLWNTTDGGGANPNAIASSDYAAESGSQLLPPGTTSFVINVPILEDGATEPDEDFTLDVDLAGALDSALGTIQDNDSPSALSVPDVVVSEAASTATFVVNFSPPLGSAQTLVWNTSDGGGANPPANSGFDYTTEAGSQVLPATTASFNVVVPILDDPSLETDEDFTVNFDLGGTLASAIGTIQDNDRSVVSVAAASAAEDDPSGVVSFNVTFSVPAPSGASFDVTVVDGGGATGATLGADYNAPSPSTVLVPTGVSSISVDVPVIDDTLEEGADETFNLTLSNLVNLTPGSLSATGTILENDFPPAVSVLRISDAIVTESGVSQTIDFGVTLTPPASTVVTVDYATVATGATAGEDFEATSGQLQFALGETSKLISVTVLGDDLEEGDESFEVRLSNAVGASIFDGVGVATIGNDDTSDPGGGGPGGGSPIVSVSDVEVTEGNGGITHAIVELTVEGQHNLPITVDYETRDLTATSLGSNADYQSRSGEVAFPPGVQEMSFNVQIMGDSTNEPDEAFEVVLTAPHNAVLGVDVGTVTIRNDDNDLPMIDVDLPSSISEGGRRVPIRLTLSGPASQQVTARVRVESLTARVGEDFEERTSNVSWSAGQTGDRTVRIGLIDDAIIEGNESFRVMIDNLSPSLASTRMSNAIVTIKDNDQAVRIVAEETSLTGRGRTELALVAQVLNQNDRFVQGARVNWTSEEVKVPVPNTISDAAGEVRQTIVLPSQPGKIRVTASLSGTEQSVTFEIDVQGNLRDLFDPDQEPTDRDVGDALDNLCIEAAGEMAEVCDYLYDLDATDQKQAVMAITPDTLPIKGDVALQATRVQMQNVAARQQALRSGARTAIGQLAFAIQGQSVSTDQLTKGVSTYSNEREDVALMVEDAMNDAWEEVEGSGQDPNQGQATVIDEREESPFGIFVNGRISIGEHERTSLEPGYDVSTRGITAGVDYKLSSSAYVGAAVGYISSDTDLTADSGELNTSGYGLTVYSGFQWNRFYVDGAVSQTWLDFDVRREIILPQAFQGQTRLTATGNTDTDQQTANLGVGYDWNFGSLGVGGFSRALYNRAKIDAFAEQGAGGFNLVLGEQSVTSFLVESGFELSYPLSYQWGVMNPVARLSYLHEFENDFRVIGGGFAFDATNEQFNIYTDQPDRNYFNFGLGLQFTFTGSRLAYIMFDTDLARDDFDQFTLTFGYRQQF